MRSVIAAAAAWLIAGAALATAEQQSSTAKQPVNTAKQPVNTAKQPVNTAKQPVNTAPKSDSLGAAIAALGADGLHTLRYSGLGSTYSVGQSPAPNAPWPRVTLKKYEVLVDYGAVSMLVDAVREGGAIQPRGGGVPFTGEQRQLQMVHGAVAWNVAYGRPARGRGAGPPPAVAPPSPPAPSPETKATPLAPQSQPGVAPVPQPPPPGGRGGPPPAEPLAPLGAPGAAAERRQQIWSTPHGFLKSALANRATTTRVPDGVEVSFDVDGRRFAGVLNARNHVERVRTWIDDPVLGDMLVETTFDGYEPFGAISFPTHIVERRGGFPALDLFVTSVEPNAKVEIAVPEAVQAQAPAPVRVDVQKIADGMFYLTGGSHHSVAVEMADHVVLVEAPQNEARSVALISALKEALPAKPIRFVVNTHHHFDHAGGLRTFVDAGATIVTHQLNKAFYERAWAAPRSINPDRLARSGRAPTFVTFAETHTLTDGSRTIELYRLAGSPHNDGFVMAYLPGEKLLIEADAFTPAEAASAAPAAPPGAPAGFPAFPPTISPTTLNLYQNIQRLKLDVGQVAALHGPRLAPLSELARAAGVSN